MKLQMAQIGPWEFAIPQGWTAKDNEVSNAYFEEPAGTMGLYVQAIELAQPRAAARQVADHIQDLRYRGFTNSVDNGWNVVDRRSEVDGVLFRSALDLYDSRASYRALSLVLCDRNTALQLTLHDYWCEDYEARREVFSEIEKSMLRVRKAA